MKKLLALSILLFSVKAHAAQDIQGSMRPALWRSSRTSTADGFVLVASGAIHFHGVIIGSPTYNTSGSIIAIFNSTTGSSGLLGFTTAFILNTNILAPGNTASSSTVVNPSFPPYYYDVLLSSGLAYQKQGLAEINILWDYIPPRREPLVPFSPGDKP